MSRVSFFTILAFCAVIDQINAEDPCVPWPVERLRITPNETLVWEPSSNNTCEISHYVVIIQYEFGEIGENYLVTDRWVDISHLTPCDDWIFTVTAVSTELVTGLIHMLFTKTPMRPGTDLSLIITKANQTDEYLALEWEVANSSIAHCVDLYHVTVLDEDTNNVTEDITSNKFKLIRDLAPCGRYQFSIKAIHRDIPEIQGPLVTRSYFEPARSPAVPRLEEITYGSTSFNSLWRPEDFSANRCYLTEVNVDGSPYFNITNFIVDTSSREPFPVNVGSLQPNTLYIFRLSIRNTGGQSPPLLLAVQTDPATSEDNH